MYTYSASSATKNFNLSNTTDVRVLGSSGRRAGFLPEKTIFLCSNYGVAMSM